MKTTHLSGILALFLSASILVGCNKDDEGLSKEEIRQALFEMKGTYRGTVHVWAPPSLDTTLQQATAVSRDSLKFRMSLQPLAELVSDEALSDRLREIGEVEVSAGYQFDHRDEGLIHFLLCPAEVIVWGGYGAPPTVRIVFSRNYGGDALVGQNFMMFNISPTELWADGEQYTGLPKIVYHFEGVYE